MRAPLAACRKPAGIYSRLSDVLYVFEHETQYLLIHTPETRIVVFWDIINTPFAKSNIRFLVGTYKECRCPFSHQPVLHRGSKCGKRHFFQIKFEHHREFPVEVWWIQVKYPYPWAGINLALTLVPSRSGNFPRTSRPISLQDQHHKSKYQGLASLIFVRRIHHN